MAAALDVPVESLRAIAQRFGTPTYAYDLSRIRVQMSRLRTHVPPCVEILYSLKANASLGLCRFIAQQGFGVDVAAAGELVTALAAGFPRERIFLTGPDKSPAVVEQLRTLPEAVVSLDSVSELELMAGAGLPQRAILRLRPDFCSYASCSAGPDSRFGLIAEDLPRCREFLGSVRVIGFHVFSGSQVLDADALGHHLRGGVELSLRAADALRIAPEIIDLGGGFGVPYAPEDEELALEAIGTELAALANRVAPVKLVMELGRYFVAQAGWYLTTVLARQTHRGREAVVVDGGSHQRSDLCGLGLRKRSFPPVVLRASVGAWERKSAESVTLSRSHAPTLTRPHIPTDVLGCLSLPSDVLIEATLLPSLAPGDVLAFPNAGAYGFAAAPLLFHGHTPPAEVAFDGMQHQPLRTRTPVAEVLRGQLGTETGRWQ